MEILLAMAVITPCLIALVNMLTVSAKELALMRGAKRMIYGEMRLVQTMQRIMQDIDKHTLPLLPRVHKGGRITLTNGQPNTIASHLSLKPSHLSDAISYLDAEPLSMLEILSASEEPEHLSFYACNRFSGIFDKKDYNTYLLLTAEHFYEATGDVSEVIQQEEKACISIRLSPTESMIAGTPTEFNILFARYILPVRAVYTIYRDETGYLRYLGHAGTLNIENQPVVDLPMDIAIDPPAPAETGTYILNITTISSSTNRRDFNIYNFLKRRPYLNLHLNYP